MNNIFISYRRADSADVVGRIYDYLEGIVGAENIFKDVHSVQLGIDYLTMTKDAVANCDVQLAILGNRWLDGRRIDDPDDLVRVEIETAMSRDIPVIPVLVGGAVMPAQDELPDGLKPLVYRNAIQVRPDPDFPTDMARLVGALEGIISIKPQSGKRFPNWAPWVAGLVLAVGVGFTAFKMLSPDEPMANPVVMIGSENRAERAMEFVDQFGSGPLADARAKVVEATNEGMETFTSIITDTGLTDEQVAAAFNETIWNLVEEKQLDTPLQLIFEHYEKMLTCREQQLCDAQVLGDYFDKQATEFSNLWYPWVCQVRAEWQNPAAFEQVLDFYIEDTSNLCG